MVNILSNYRFLDKFSDPRAIIFVVRNQLAYGLTDIHCTGQIRSRHLDAMKVLKNELSSVLLQNATMLLNYVC